MIDFIRIRNLRSFHGDFTIPLKRFNLLFGNNGAGKSSIIEAIQLCMTGSSDRTFYDNTVELVNEIRTEGEAFGLLVELISNLNRGASRFDDNGHCLGYTELLELFYSRTAHYKTAKSLLRTLFATHNTISQEKIIRLLDADNVKTFTTSVEEMLVGRDLVERWEKVLKAKESLRKLSNEAEKSLSEKETSLKHIEQHLAEWNQISEKELWVEYGELVTLMEGQGIILPEQPMDKSLLQNVLKWLHDSRAVIERLKNGIRGINHLKPENMDIISISTLQLTRAESENVVTQNENTMANFNQKLFTLKERNLDLLTRSQELASSLDNLTKRIEHEDSIFNDLKLMNDWRLEFVADLNLGNIEKDLRECDSDIELINKIDVMIAELPTKEEFLSVRKGLGETRDAIKKIERLMEENEGVLKTKESEYGMLYNEYLAWERSQKESVALLEKLHLIVEQILLSHETNNCPTCGTPFDSKATLVNKITTNIDGTRQREHIFIPLKFNILPTIKEEVDKIKETFPERSREIEALKKSLENNLARCTRWLELGSVIRELLLNAGLASLDFCTLDTFEMYLSELNELRLENVLQLRLEKKTALTTVILTTWSGLRKNEFVKVKTYFVNKLPGHELKTLIDKLLDYDIWESQLSTTCESLSNSRTERDTLINELTSSQTELINNEAEISKLRIMVTDYEDAIEKTKVAIKKIDSLIAESFNLLEHFREHTGSINTASLRPVIDSVLAKINALEASIISLLNSHKSRQSSEVQRDTIREAIEVGKKKLKLLREISRRFRTINKLEARISGEWLKYEDNINRLFGSLHSPPDYSAVRLIMPQQTIQVTSKATGELKPATVLSSGQRAALALSIFWTLNLYGIDMPDIMLMDEPIQQIDDLNSLNFLDSLRWINETSGRQTLISTANSRVAGLIRRKFSYLAEDYNEITLERYYGLSPIVRCTNGSGHVYYVSGPAKRSA